MDLQTAALLLCQQLCDLGFLNRFTSYNNEQTDFKKTFLRAELH